MVKCVTVEWEMEKPNEEVRRRERLRKLEEAKWVTWIVELIRFDETVSYWGVLSH
jgi:hypothetical protein